MNASPGAGGTPTGSGTYDTGTDAPITAGTASGYTFDGWTGCSPANAGAESTTVAVTADTTCTATFSVQTFTLTVSASPGAGGTPTGSGTFDTGTDAPITAGTNLGYRFDGWTGCSPANVGAESTTVAVTADTTCTANFVQQFLS